MSASLGATTYTSITWTAGDTITEAKLDSMVANDQAYDSHASQGLLLNNNKSFAGKNASGSTNQNLIKIDSSDLIQVGEDNVGDHTVLNAGTNKLVKIKVLRQNDTTNSYQKDTVILTGWGQVQGAGSASAQETVTFGVTFSATPIVLVSKLGNKQTTPATNIDDFNSGSPTYARQLNLSTSNFTAFVGTASGVLDVGWYYGYSWVAIGTL